MDAMIKSIRTATKDIARSQARQEDQAELQHRALGAVVERLDRLIESQRESKLDKRALILGLVAAAAAACFPPWRLPNGLLIGFGFLFAPPRVGRIDMSQLVSEWVLIAVSVFAWSRWQGLRDRRE